MQELRYIKNDIPQVMLMKVNHLGRRVRTNVQWWRVEIKRGHREYATFHENEIRELLEMMYEYPLYVREAA